MKFRSDFVTNSSSSSFIITNKTDSILTGKEIAEQLKEQFEKYKNNPSGWYRDELEKITVEEFVEATEKCIPKLDPLEALLIECGDNLHDDGVFECFIYSETDCYVPTETEKFIIEFDESHH